MAQKPKKPTKKPAVKKPLAKKAAAPDLARLLERAGDAFYDHGADDKARSLLVRAAASARTKPQRRRVREAWVEYGTRRLRGSQWSDAAAYFEGALALEPTLHRVLNDYACALCQLGKLDLARETALRARTLATTAEDAPAVQVSEYHLATIAAERADFEASIQHARAATASCTNPYDRCFYLYSEARGLFELGRYDEASEAAQRGLDDAVEANNEVLEAHLRNLLGNAALEDGRLDEATEHYDQAIALFERAKNPAAAAITRANTGNIARDRGDCEAAIEIYDRALRRHKRDRDHRSYAVVLTDRGGACAELGRFDEAERDLDKALALLVRLGQTRRLSFVRTALAVLAETRGDLATAGAWYVESELSFEQVGDALQVARMLLGMAGVRAELGDLDGAAQLIDRAVALEPTLRDPTLQRNGADATRALHQLAQGRLEVARARGASVDAELLASARKRLDRVTRAPDSYTARNAEVRRVANRLRATLAQR